MLKAEAATIPPALSNEPDLDHFWMPFTPNRAFRRNPRLFVGAEGCYYIAEDGRRILDGMAGLWCVNAGHGHPAIVAAIKHQADRLDFVSSFQMSHPAAFALAAQLAGTAPTGLEHVFFVNSGSEAVDTALKIARAYHAAKGAAGRTRLIGRLKGYHGMGWGGLSVGGIGRHRQAFGPLLPGTDHLALPYGPSSRFSRGQPTQGAEMADELLQLVQLHGAETIAAVIVEPVVGSGGVYPPPVGYLERLRAHCDLHGILLIFDEVITGFGRLGTAFAAQRFGVRPDIITCAKGLTNGAVPMGAVLVSNAIHAAFMAGPEPVIELFHGYTYSAHPLACAAAQATLDVHEREGLAGRVAAVEPVWQAAAHGLLGSRHVVDVRGLGLLAAIELDPRPGSPGVRGQDCANACYDRGVLVRASGDTIVLSPPLTITESEIARIFETLAAVLASLD